MSANHSPPAASTPVSPHGTESTPSSSTPSAAGTEGRTARDESPLARYARATGPDGWLTPAGWLRLASDLDAEAARLVTPSIDSLARRLCDRAADCRQRAARLTRGAL